MEVYNARFVRGYARFPTFDETSKFRDDLDRRVSEYLTKNPQLATSPRASQFRFERRVDVGTTRPEVTLLLGEPDLMSTDPVLMGATAQAFWSDISNRAKEMWRYPSGWAVYFDSERVVDLTVAGKPPLE
jgi:hypothetical protein